MVSMIKNSQIVMLPGGFSAGDEPDGSGKFIATMFRNPRIKEAVTEFLNERDGLMPVSYTHLDVYKRQQYSSGILLLPAVEKATV